MLRKRREPKAKKTVVEALLRDMQGTAAEKLALSQLGMWQSESSHPSLPLGRY